MSTPKPKSDEREDQTELPPAEDGPEPTLPGVAQPEEVETEEDQAEDDGDESEEDTDGKPKAKRRGKAKAKKPETDEPEAVQLPVVQPPPPLEGPAKPAKVPYQEFAALLVENIVGLTEDVPRESRFFVCRTALAYAVKLLPRQFVAATKRAA